MSTPKKERDIMRELITASRGDIRWYLSDLMARGCSTIGKLRRERTNAQRDANAKTNALACSRAEANRLRQERDASQSVSTRMANDLAKRCRELANSRDSAGRAWIAVQRLTADCDKVVKQRDQYVTLYDETRAELQAVQQDRDETFARLTTSYATCAKLEYEGQQALGRCEQLAEAYAAAERSAVKSATVNRLLSHTNEVLHNERDEYRDRLRRVFAVCKVVL